MNVILLRHTPDPDGVVALAARLCYSRDGIGEIIGKAARGDARAFIGKIVSLGHHSVLEHAVFTFGVEGISRACSHQLVRHRLASYSQKSQRYVVEDKPFVHVVPPAIRRGKKLAALFESKMAEIHAAYRELLAAGVPAEDARYVLPNAAETKLVVTMNARELRHFFTLRLCQRAQWEIRELAERMLEKSSAAAPLLFAGCGPSCVGGPCPEGKMTCGEIVQVRRKYRARRAGGKK
jgi:thymidylate synthase (FAD)